MTVGASTPEGSVLRPPGAVIDIARTLQQAGHAAWCVGGAVRDALLGVDNLDWDLATSATPPEVRRLFRRTVPVGIEFGTVGVFGRDGRMHEVTTFRRDVHTDGRHAVVEFGASLTEDLARRDFTINAIAWDPLARQLADPFGGRADLAARIVRAVGDPEARLTEDRLRALRAIRFAARFALTIEPATWAAICGSAPHLPRLSPERVRQEIEKTLEQVGRPSDAFRLWREAGAFASVVPPLATVADAVLAAVDCLPRPGAPTRPLRRSLRLAALLSGLDAKEAEHALRGLRASNQEVATVSALVAGWHRHGDALRALAVAEGELEAQPLRLAVSQMGRLRVAGTLRLVAARWAAAGAAAGAPTGVQVRRLYRRALQVAFRDPVEVGDLAIDGEDLRALGIPAGPLMGQWLRTLLVDVLDDPGRNRREWLMARVREQQGQPAAGP
jgi:tRNA nucleotidyltransferase (CCA-adding enzyme)